MRPTALLLALAPLATAAGDLPTLGRIERTDAGLDDVLAPFARLEVLAVGHVWTEGPLWVPAGVMGQDAGSLLFADIPRNAVYRWRDDGQGESVLIRPSGYTGIADYSSEPGSNGMALDAEGRLLSCEHGDRRVSRMTADGGKLTLADRFEGRRLNSPNDLCVADDGSVYFTDPPYGLPGQADSDLRELDFCGVYRIAPDGELSLLTKEMSRPNGIGLSPDGKTLYVANSDPKAAVWKAFAVNEDGSLGESRVFYDATASAGSMKGLPDGLAVDAEGRVWGTGPGGVWVFTAEGRPLGRIETGEATSNCCFGGEDGSTLFVTADMYVARIATKTRAAR